jgi:hypothetical protein
MTSLFFSTNDEIRDAIAADFITFDNDSDAGDEEVVVVVVVVDVEATDAESREVERF